MQYFSFFLLVVLLSFSYAQNSQTCPEGEHLFSHELLTVDAVCIPDNPQRIVALDMASVEASLLAGKEVIALSSWVKNELPMLVPAFAASLEDAENVGYPANLEQLLRLDPDIILVADASEAGESIDIEQARAIAPIVVADPIIYTNWQLGMQLWSGVLGVEDVYDAMLENYDARIAELQAAIGDPSDTTVSITSTSSYGLMMWMPDTAPGKVIGDVGFSRPAAQNVVGEAAEALYSADKYITISEEKLDLIEADALLYFTYAASDEETAEKEATAISDYESKAIWQALQVVQSGNAHLVGGHWWRPQTYYLANLALDDLFRLFAESSDAETEILSLEHVREVAHDVAHE